MASIITNGAEIAYQQIGEGPDLVLVHGLAASRAFWFAQYALPLARHCRVTLYDLRGHGYSSRPPSGYDAANQARDLAGLLDALQIGQCSLVGHSFGGAVAVEFTARHPGSVSRLALLDSKINCVQPLQRLWDCPELSPFEQEVAARSGHDWENEPQVGLLFLEVLARWRTAGGEPGTRDPFTPFGEGRGAIRAAKQWLELIDTTSARGEFSLPGLPAEAIAALSLPILLYYAGDSRCMPSCHALRQLLPAADVEIIDKGGHFFPINQCRTVFPRLARFLGLQHAAAMGA